MELPLSQQRRPSATPHLESQFATTAPNCVLLSSITQLQNVWGTAGRTPITADVLQNPQALSGQSAQASKWPESPSEPACLLPSLHWFGELVRPALRIP